MFTCTVVSLNTGVNIILFLLLYILVNDVYNAHLMVMVMRFQEVFFSDLRYVISELTYDQKKNKTKKQQYLFPLIIQTLILSADPKVFFAIFRQALLNSDSCPI